MIIIYKSETLFVVAESRAIVGDRPLGTKGGKPITAIEKRQMRALREELKKQREKREKRIALDLIDPSIVDKIAREIKSFDVITPFVLAQKYNIKYSTAKKVIKELASRGMLDIVLKSRRIIIAVPKVRAQQ